MSPELIAIIAATVTLGDLVTVQFAGVRASISALDGRLRAVETELAYLRGLMQGAGVGPIRQPEQPQQPEPPAVDEGAAA